MQPWERISPRSLSWAEVDPARHPFDPTSVPGVVAALAPPVPPPPRQEGSRRIGEDRAERWRDAVSHGLVDRYGRWASGWCWGIGEGDHDGGPVGGWCCVWHSFGAPEETLARVADSLVEWRGWLEEQAARLERLLPTLDPDQPADDLVIAWEIAVAQVVTSVVDRTESESGWYDHCAQVLGWLLTAAGIADRDHERLVTAAIGGRFHSSVEPAGTDVTAVAEDLARGVVDGAVPDPRAPRRPGDALTAWLSVRTRVDWPAVAGPVHGPVRGDHDAIADHFATLPGADRLAAALTEVRAAAEGGGPLSFALLSRWQRIVLAVADAPFRAGLARAKDGREIYHWRPDLPELFERHLADATDPAVPLPSRAARVYLDVAFFHPFDDGNARAATLALYYVLAREGVVLDRARPLLTISRPAHDLVGAAGLAGLIEVLISRMRDRAVR